MHNFFGVQNKVNNFRKGSFIDPYDEPTYLTFALDFHFENAANSIIDPIEGSPLFEEPDGENNSAMAYLGSSDIFRKDKEQSLRTFKSILKYLTFEAPWYFQEISGLEKLWTNSTDIKSGTKAEEITINTLEAIDLRITELASLYRSAIYDKHNLRETIPDNLRWFAMDIWIAETRNLRYTMPGAAGNIANNTRIGGFTNSLVNTASTITSSFGNSDPTSTIEQFGFVKFKCRQCEFDFSESFPKGNTSTMSIETGNTPATNSFKIKIGYFEEESKFYDGTELYDNRISAAVRDPWAMRGEMQNTRDMVNTVSGLPLVRGAKDKISDGIGKVSDAAISKMQGWVPDAVRAAITNLSSIGTAYSNPEKRAEVKSLGDKYPDFQAPSSVTDLGDIYP